MFRRVILPTVRLLLLAVIAVALVKLAFGDDADAVSDEGGPLTPSATVSDPHVPVGRGTVENTVTVDASITADPAVMVKATAEGKINKILVAKGSRVAAGDKLLEVVFEEPQDPARSTDAEGNVVETPRPPKKKTAVVTAPVAGTVVDYSVLVGQSVTIGGDVGSIVPGTFSVNGTVTTDQQYRLLSAPSSAQVTLQGGPAPFECAGLSIGRMSSDQEQQQQPTTYDQFGMPVTGASTIRCSVPAGVTVFDGMLATMSVQAGKAENVLVVPVTAVQGSFATGNVWVVGADGQQEERQVKLGLTDGEQVEVTEGLTEGDLLLQFVPVANDKAATRPGEGFVG